jgi:hypothetical protein
LNYFKNSFRTFQIILGDKVLVVGKQTGKAELYGTGTVLPGRQLHSHPIRDDSSKITFSVLTVKNISMVTPFYPDKNGENSLVHIDI